MLAKPNVIDMSSKVGDRYEVAIAVAKRARQIEKKRYETGDRDIRDSVDLATEEIYEDKVKIIKNGSYVVEPEKPENEEEDLATKSIIDDSDKINENEIKAKVQGIKNEAESKHKKEKSIKKSNKIKNEDEKEDKDE